MAFQLLEEFARLHIPQPPDMVAAAREQLRALRIEYHLGYLPLMVLQHSRTGPIRNIIHSGCAVDTGRGDLRTDRVEVYIEDLVGVADEGVHAFTRADVPELTGFVD